MRRATKLLLIVLALALLAASCAPPPSPALRPFGDNKHWILLEDMEWLVGDTNTRIVVPAGFVTDFASIPPALASFGLSPNGQYSRAAIIHDCLYWVQSCTRKQSDRLMVVAMKESDTGSFKENVIYEGVDRAGGFAWRSNAKQRQAGLPRIVPERYRRPENPNIK